MDSNNTRTPTNLEQEDGTLTGISRETRNGSVMYKVEDAPSPPLCTGISRGRRDDGVVYKVEDVPSPPLCLLFGLQHAIMTVGSTISIPFIISGLICAGDKPEVTAKLLSITLFMCGIATIVQCLVGIRLGIIQGGSHTFIAPIVAMVTLETWACQTADLKEDDVWMSRISEIQGNLMLASLIQLVLGMTGLLGFVLRLIGPLTIVPTVSLVRLSLTNVIMDFCKVHLGIAFLSLSLIVLFALFLKDFQIPLPSWKSGQGFHLQRHPLFQLFPVILSVTISWSVCHVLTVTDVFTNNVNATGFLARTDARLSVLGNSPWLFWPYPFQFGWPTVSAAGFVGFMAATISSIIESVGDYNAAARISGVLPPPPHAINRGIAVEGLCSVISGMVGAGHGMTSYSGNIGAIGITKVASRSVFISAGVILVAGGVVGKMGAFLSLIPDPIIGGILVVVMGMVVSVGLSVLKFVDLDSVRNLTILGLSLLLGLMVPGFVNNAANANVINTGYPELDQTIKVLLGTAIFVGGFVGFVLDNIVPGTYEERGILRWRATNSSVFDSDVRNRNDDVTYSLPFVSEYLQRTNCCPYVPLSPAFYAERHLACCKSKSNRKYCKDASSFELSHLPNL